MNMNFENIKSEFSSHDAMEDELKFISLFSVFNHIPIETILKMSRSRFDFIVTSIKEYNEQQEREKSLIKNTSVVGGTLG